MRMLYSLTFVPLALVLLSAGWIVCSYRTNHTVTQEKIVKVQVGMAEKEVEAILGGPENGKGETLLTPNFITKRLSPQRKTWIGSDVGVIVSFDEATGMVNGVIPGMPLDRDWFPDNVLRDLGLKPRAKQNSLAWGIVY